MTDLGDHLRRTIAERGVSLRATARRAGCSPGYLSNVIHGRKPLTPRVAAGLDQALGTGNAFTGYTLNPVPGLSRLPPESTSGLDHAAGTASRSDDRRTAEALRALTADDLTSPGECHLPVERAAIRSEPLLYAAERTAFGVPASLPGIAAGAGAVTEDHVIQVEIAAAVFRSWDNAHGGGLRRKAVIGQLAEVTALLGGPFTSGQVARRLYAATADLAQLAGWMS
jgi:transcriptional regulator with XRE-family HTH domain